QRRMQNPLLCTKEVRPVKERVSSSGLSQVLHCNLPNGLQYFNHFNSLGDCKTRSARRNNGTHELRQNNKDIRNTENTSALRRSHSAPSLPIATWILGVFLPKLLGSHYVKIINCLRVKITTWILPS
ncbi:hypothetical protein L9F63_015262, partial [Diploptera punctata]